jgi:hypothetical protein
MELESRVSKGYCMGGQMDHALFILHLRLNFSTETGGLISATLDQGRLGAGFRGAQKVIVWGDQWMVIFTSIYGLIFQQKQVVLLVLH